MTTAWHQSGTYRGGTEECPAPPTKPADQPGRNAGTDCEEWPNPTPPAREWKDECTSFKSADCKCPPGPTAEEDCFQELINDQVEAITLADKAKQFKTDLEAFVTKARTAAQEYTRDKYKALLADWKKQDREIAELLGKLECIPCWRCILDCHICPAINRIHSDEVYLYGDGTLLGSGANLFDVRYWRERDVEIKRRRFERIKSVVAAWEKPVQGIEKALADNRKLIDACKAGGAEPGKVIYDLFVKLVPMHLAIAPPAGVEKTTISADYVGLCKCDTGKPHWCCGIDIGAWSVSQRLVGPQPYLIDPSEYLKLVCCLITKAYSPGKDAVAEAEVAFQKVDGEIKRVQTRIDDALKTFDKTVRGAVPGAFDCCEYRPEAEPTGSTAR